MTATITQPAQERTHCRRNHALTETNTRWVERATGMFPRCKTCEQDNQAKRRRQKRQAQQQQADEQVPAFVEGRTLRLVAAPETHAPDASWMERSACKGADLAEFFANDGEAVLPERARRTAAQFCDGCPVRQLCKTWAEGMDCEGLWGGEWRFNPSKNRLPVDLLAVPDEEQAA